MSEVGSKRKRPRKRVKDVVSIPDDEELKILEKIVLGTGSKVVDASHSDEDSDIEEASGKKIERTEEPERKPAWVDEDDLVTYGEVLEKKRRRCELVVTASKNFEDVAKKRYQQVMGVPKWSKMSRKSDDSVEGLLNTCGKFIKKPNFLAGGSLEFKKLKLLNFETKSEGPFVNVVKFHPKSTVAVVAGVSGVVSLFQVDGKQNAKLHSLQFQKYPIYCGSFLKDGKEFIVGSQFHNFFYCHDLMTGKSMKITNSKLNNLTKTKSFCVSPNDELIAVCGNSGKIFLFATSTKEYIDCLQMNCSVSAVNFNNEGSILYSHGEDGEVYLWDMKSRTCIRKFIDEGCLNGTSIAVSPNDQFLACGSTSGVVNIYDCKSVHSGEHFLPVKTLYNLLVPVTTAKFNSTSEILAVASNKKERALKLVHCSSMTVFSDFPQYASKIRRPLCVDFSPNSGFFAVGDSHSCAHLFRLKHFGNY